MWHRCHRLAVLFSQEKGVGSGAGAQSGFFSEQVEKFLDQA